MSVLSEFAAKHKEYSNKMDVALAGLHGDVQYLSDKIRELQESPGQITAADQKLLDEIDAHSKEVVDKLTALDDLTPPKPPVA